jgi:hypothetical protein
MSTDQPALASLPGVETLEKILLVANGQTLYLCLASFGLLPIGLAHAAQRALQAWRSQGSVGLGSAAGAGFLFILLSSGAIWAMSVLYLALARDYRFEFVLYGRYNEGFLALYLALGLAWLYLRRRQAREVARLAGWALGLTGLLAIAFLLTRPESRELVWVNRFGILPWILAGRKLCGEIRWEVPIAGALLSACVLLGVFLRRPGWGAWALGAGLLGLDLFLFLFLRLIEPKPVTLVDALRAAGPPQRVAYDMSRWSARHYSLYQYFLPHTRFVPFWPEREEAPVADALISGRRNDALEAQGLVRAAQEEDADQALYVPPP